MSVARYLRIARRCNLACPRSRATPKSHPEEARVGPNPVATAPGLVDHRGGSASHSMSSPRRRGSRAGTAASALRSTTGSRPHAGKLSLRRRVRHAAYIHHRCCRPGPRNPAPGWLTARPSNHRPAVWGHAAYIRPRCCRPGPPTRRQRLTYRHWIPACAAMTEGVVDRVDDGFYRGERSRCRRLCRCLGGVCSLSPPPIHGMTGRCRGRVGVLGFVSFSASSRASICTATECAMRCCCASASCTTRKTAASPSYGSFMGRGSEVRGGVAYCAK